MQEGIAHGKSVVDLWMKGLSDTIQAVAKAYGERTVLEQCIDEINSCDISISRILIQVVKLWVVCSLKEDLSFFLIHNLVTEESARKIPTEIRSLIQTIAPQVEHIVLSLGLKGMPLQSPISKDNKIGQLIQSKL